VKTGVQNQLNLLDVACASEDTCFRRNDKKAAEESKAMVAAGFSLRIVSYIIVACLLGSFLFTVKANLSGKSIENGIACEDNGFIFNAYLSYIDAIYDMPIDNDGYIKVVGVLKRLYEGEADPGKKENIKNSLKMYLNKIEKKGDLDSGLFFVAGMSYTTLRETNKAEGYLLKAISYYPSSAYYIYEIVRFYVNNNEPEKAKQWAHAVDPYLDKYRTSRNPKGFYVYKIRDMEAGMEYKQGNIAAASSIAKNNLRDAKEERFVISSIRLGGNVSKTSMVNYLKTKYEYYENLSTGK
jgi:tetratricopeptide (TPR) repeat protein